MMRQERTMSVPLPPTPDPERLQRAMRGNIRGPLGRAVPARPRLFARLPGEAL